MKTEVEYELIQSLKEHAKGTLMILETERRVPYSVIVNLLAAVDACQKAQKELDKLESVV